MWRRFSFPEPDRPVHQGLQPDVALQADLALLQYPSVPACVLAQGDVMITRVQGELLRPSFPPFLPPPLSWQCSH